MEVSGEKFNFSYRLLKKLIKENCKDDPNEPLKFIVNFAGLEAALEKNNIGICLVYNGTRSKYINQDSIVLLSQQYNGDRLKWFDSHKQYTALVFVRKDAVDEVARRIMRELRNQREGEKDAIDRVALIAELIANYPCYIANIVSYKGNNPERIGRNSYTINVRANLIQRQDEQYTYNAEDLGN